MQFSDFCKDVYVLHSNITWEEGIVTKPQVYLQ